MNECIQVLTDYFSLVKVTILTLYIYYSLLSIDYNNNNNNID